MTGEEKEAREHPAFPQWYMDNVEDGECGEMFEDWYPWWVQFAEGYERGYYDRSNHPRA